MCNINELQAYAAYLDDERVLNNSSSGGMFTVFSRYIISQGGVVYGAAMNSDCKSAAFRRVEDACGLDIFSGSIYFQVPIGSAFSEIEQDLINNRLVLFVGTPCQVNAIKAYLKNDYSNLFCIDIICHGVPSTKIWEKYLESISINHVERVNFRCKKRNWINYGMEITYDNKKRFISKENNSYMFLFLNDLSLRPSCYKCNSKNNNKSDITLGDLWGVQNIDKSMINDYRGCSFVIVRTHKGTELFKKIERDICYKSIVYREAVRYNRAEVESMDRPSKRDALYRELNEKGYKYIENKYFKLSLKRIIKKILHGV